MIQSHANLLLPTTLLTWLVLCVWPTDDEGIYSSQPRETTCDVVLYSVAQRLQGMPHSPVKFTGAPDAQHLQEMPYSLVKFTVNSVGSTLVSCLNDQCTCYHFVHA